ncbi:CopG family transcriptional regulator [Streptomyces scabiei]|uniref:CopG family transcriptional regulator n=1 Tax=Streptomyces scabiei TaxID=1930 RepID=UPI00298FFF14|nr:CopG family transcriptional regulator [Streptomyces scabiei]MDW8808824.1 CopG family transcriptional regulator [Streptomyces scabiei]
MNGPTGRYSITMPRDIAEAAKARSGPSGLSACVAAAVAVARQIERDNLNELIQVAETEHGPVTDEETQALRDQPHEARRQQARGGVSAV